MPDLGNLETPYITSSVLLCLGGHLQVLVLPSRYGTYGTGRFFQKPSHPQKLSKAMWLPVARLGSCGWLLTGQTLSMAGFMGSYRSVGRMLGQGLAYAQTSQAQI